MRGTNGLLGLIIEVAALGLGGFIYQTGFGAGPQGVVSMLGGAAVAGIGLLIGGILGVTGLTKEGEKPLAAAIAVIIPLGVLVAIIARRMFSL